MTKRATFSKTAITRAIDGARAGGIDVGQVDICPNSGMITIHARSDTPKNPLDDWITQKNASQRRS